MTDTHVIDFRCPNCRGMSDTEDITDTMQLGKPMRYCTRCELVYAPAELVLPSVPPRKDIDG